MLSQPPFCAIAIAGSAAEKSTIAGGRPVQRFGGTAKRNRKTKVRRRVSFIPTVCIRVGPRGDFFLRRARLSVRSGWAGTSVLRGGHFRQERCGPAAPAGAGDRCEARQPPPPF